MSDPRAHREGRESLDLDPKRRGAEAVTKRVARNSPWFAISIGAHAIVIAWFSVQVFQPPRPEPAIRLDPRPIEVSRAPDEIELHPEPLVREPAPLPVDADPEPADFLEPEPFVSATIAEESSTVGDSDAPDLGVPGSTNIGVGENGHRGFRVATHAGRLGTGGKGNKYATRRNHGPNKPSDKILGPALDWLARHQATNGAWLAHDFSEQCSTNRCAGEGDAVHCVGVTGIALLAFLGAGSTSESGPFHDNVRRGVKYLREIQNVETGEFGERTGADGWIYDQALASLAMCEAYGLSGNPVLKRSAQKAVNFCQAGRNPYHGWRYRHPGNGENDVSVTGWMVMVLRSAKDFGLVVDESALDGAKLLLDEMTDPSTGRCGYIQRGGASAREPGMVDRWPASKVEAMTAVAMMCRIFLDEDPATSPALRSGADLLRKSLPVWDATSGQIDFYYWYYGSYAMFQMGGADWKAWESKMMDAIVAQQRQDGCERGSWDPQVDPWGHRGGRVYSTAMLALCSEVYYRYARVIGGRR